MKGLKRKALTQINLKLPEEVVNKLDSKASKLGLSRTSYIKLITINDITIHLNDSKLLTV